MTKFIEIGSQYINIDNITHFDAKVMVKNSIRHEIFEEDLHSYVNKENFIVQGYFVHVYFSGEPVKDLKLSFNNKSEINSFISRVLNS